jgi:hypothetical protein
VSGLADVFGTVPPSYESYTSDGCQVKSDGCEFCLITHPIIQPVRKCRRMTHQIQKLTKQNVRKQLKTILFCSGTHPDKGLGSSNFPPMALVFLKMCILVLLVLGDRVRVKVESLGLIS